MGGGGPVIGRRIVVTGLAGSGKSTLSIALAAATGLPLVHLDLWYWQPGWTAPSDDHWRAAQRTALAGDAWIADGNYSDTLDLRLALADTVVALDLPWWRCSARALRRGFRMPGELPPGCHYTRFERWRDEWRLAGRIWRKRRTEPAVEREVIARHADRLTVHVLRSPREVDDLLAAVTSGAQARRARIVRLSDPPSHDEDLRR
jgi:adenylate kinase family enzyme